MHPGGGIYAASASGYVAPVVSALANGDTNTSAFSTRYVGVRFDGDGEEYELTGVSSTALTATVGTWLDAGSSDDVWVEFIRTSGATKFTNRSNNTRYNILTGVTFYGVDSNVASPNFSITGYFVFHDAASGGSVLQTTSSATWTASYFDPCPLCCFTPDTLVTMARGIMVPIASIQPGDEIVVVGSDMKTLKSEPVTGIITRDNRPMFRLRFASGRILEASEDHPLHVDGKGAASLNHYDTEYKNLGLPAQLAVGDLVVDESGRYDRLMNIEPMDYPETVYTLENSMFFANGLLVY